MADEMIPKKSMENPNPVEMEPVEEPIKEEVAAVAVEEEETEETKKEEETVEEQQPEELLPIDGIGISPSARNAIESMIKNEQCVIDPDYLPSFWTGLEEGDPVLRGIVNNMWRDVNGIPKVDVDLRYGPSRKPTPGTSSDNNENDPKQNAEVSPPDVGEFVISPVGSPRDTDSSNVNSNEVLIRNFREIKNKRKQKELNRTQNDPVQEPIVDSTEEKQKSRKRQIQNQGSTSSETSTLSAVSSMSPNVDTSTTNSTTNASRENSPELNITDHQRKPKDERPAGNKCVAH